jgi:hypothetical protein
MANQIVVSAGAKVRNLQDVIIGTSGVLTSLGFDVANGVPRLDVNGKILVSQLPNSVMEYKGTWNAATNTPTLVNGTGNQGDVYLCNVAGTVDFGAGAIAFFVGDQVIYSGSIWQRASGATGTVTSVGITETGDSLNITGSPITTSGTINIGFNGTNLQYVNGAGNLTTFPTLITSIGLSMPSAFSVANSPLTANGTIAVTGAGVASQYIRGDGTLANFPTSGGGGSSVSYYLNGSINQGTIGGVTYYEMNKVPVIGAGTDFSRGSNGYIASFLTDANDPALLEIPAGNWNFETYLSASSGGGSPTFYIELYKYDGTTFTLIASNSAFPKLINDGTSIEAYFSALAVPQTSLTLTDRLAVRIYVTTAGRTITLHTENSHLCQVITTFSTGLTALNGLTAQVQYFQVGTSGSDFNISSTTATHTFNLPTASAANRGALSSADWTTFNNKQSALTNPITGTGTSGQVAYFNGTSSLTSSATFAFTPTSQLLVNNSVTAASAIARGTNLTPTLVASANSDVLVGLDITPTFTNGAFTGVNNIGIRLSNVRGGLMWLGALQGNSGTGTQAYQFTTNDTTNVGTMIVSQRNASGSGTALFVQQLGTGLGLNVATGNTILGSATSTTHRLEVNGSGLFNGTLTGVPSLRVSGSITAASLAQGLFINPTLIASANNDALIGLDINPTFTNGAFTGVSNIALRINGTTTTSFLSNGNILINQATDYGHKVAINSGAGSALRVDANSGFTALSIGGTGILSVDSASSGGRFIITSAGFVGINNNSPSVLLDVNGSTKIQGGASTALRLDANSNVDALSIGGVGRFSVDSGVAGGRFRIFTNGNTTINQNTDAGFRLDVNGTGRFSGALTGTSATFSGVLKNTGDLIVSQGNNGSWTGKGLAMAYSVGSDTGLLYSYDYTGGVYKPIKIIGSTIVLQVSAIEALTIASTGAATFKTTGMTNSVIIGVIVGGSYSVVSLNGTNAEGQYIGIAGGGGTDKALYYNSGNGGDHIFRVGDGTNYSTKLTIASGGAATFSSSVTATGFFESSDSGLKTLIQDNYQTKGIASITPKLYTKNGKVELGYYAQDFVGILDSAVSKGSDDMLSLSYREVLVAKVYALEQEIKELKAKMN